MHSYGWEGLAKTIAAFKLVVISVSTPLTYTGIRLGYWWIWGTSQVWVSASYAELGNTLLTRVRSTIVGCSYARWCLKDSDARWTADGIVTHPCRVLDLHALRCWDVLLRDRWCLVSACFVLSALNAHNDGWKRYLRDSRFRVLISQKNSHPFQIDYVSNRRLMLH